MPRLCVFCASALGNRPEYARAARQLGAELGKRGIGLVYGGASVGLMGLIADSALEAGAEVIGVIPRTLVDREVAHVGLSETHVVDTLAERKAKMAELSDAYLALPGGYGTLDELFEVLTWAQLGVSRKPIALWNVEKYWDSLVAMLDHAAKEGLLRSTERERLIVSDDLDQALARLF
jgi:uncharacterized protein (TIGR00730 family)